MSLRARVVAFLIAVVLAKQTQRVQPRGFNYTAEPEHLSLAITEKLTIPLIGSISSKILYVPENAGECTTSETRTRYKQVASRSLDRAEGTIVTSILTLNSHELVFTIDQFFYLSVYSLNSSNLLKEPVSSRKILEQNSTSFGSNPKLIATPNESVVYVLSSLGYSYFNIQSLSTEIKMSSENPLSGELYTALVYKGHMFVASGPAGIGIYRIEENHDLKFVHNIADIHCMDVKIDVERGYLYGLDVRNGVHVFDVKEPNKPQNYDTIDLTNLTTLNAFLQINGNTILVMFFRNNRNIIIELSYDHVQRSWAFIRYFKFKADINEMHLMDNHFIVLGHEFLAVMPTSIHPKLIREELNGYVSMSPIKTGKVYQQPFFIGITEHSIVLGAIEVSQYETIECKLEATSQLKKIIYKANLSSCSETAGRGYFDYCEYEKEFFINHMDIVAPESIAKLVWGLLIAFVALLVGGCLFLCVMRTRKIKKIRKMEMEFEQKLQNIALPSARITDRVGTDVRT